MKEKLKILGFECIYIVSIIVTSIVYNLIQFAGKKFIASNTDVLFGGNDYRYNSLAYIVGVILFGFTLWFLHEWILKKHLEDIVKTGLIFKTVYTLISLFFCIVMFFIQIGEYLILLGLNDNIYPELLTFITFFGWPVAAFIFMIVRMILASLKKEKVKTEEKKEPSVKYSDYSKKKKKN